MKTKKKKKKKCATYKDKKESKDNVPEWAQISKLVDKDFKSLIINMSKELNEILVKEIKRNIATVSLKISTRGFF